MDKIEKLKKQLLDIIKKESVFKGEFILASGKKSNFYIDMRRTSLHPMGAKLIGEIIFKKIKHLDFDSSDDCEGRHSPLSDTRQ